MQRTVDSSKKSNYWLIAGLSLLAVAVNFLRIPLFDDNQILLGNAFAIALTIIYGIRVGLPVALLASLVSFYQWEHFYGITPFVLEVLAIALAMHRQRSILLIGVIYWLTIGWLVVALLYGSLGDYSEVVLRGIILKYILNGFFTVLLGFAIFHGLRAINAEPRVRYRTELAEMLVNTGLFTVLFVASLVIYFWLRAVNVELYLQTEKQTQFVTQLIADRTNTHFEQNHLALAAAAQQLSEQPTLLELQRSISAIHDKYPEFITLLVTDERGDILVTSPIDALASATDVINVADRDYFYQVQQTLLPFSSNAFRGRGFGNDPIVALSVPYFNNGNFAGVVEGSLNLTMLAQLGNGIGADQHYYLITDSNNRVVFASPQFGFDFLDELSGSALLTTDQSSLMMNSAEGVHGFIIERQLMSQKEWLITVAGSMDSYEESLGEYLLGSIVLLAGLAMLSIMAIFRLTNSLTRPIAELVEKLHNHHDLGNLSRLTHTGTTRYVHELSELQQSFSNFTNRLRDTLTDLRQSNSMNSELNKRLQQANDLLEERVQERTEQLEIALHSASAASNVKSQFLANMSHEVRTPLHGVLGLTEILLADPSAEQFHDKLELIEQSGRHLLSIVDDILDFAKTEAGKLPLQPVPTAVLAFVEPLITSYQKRTAESSLTIHLISAELPEQVLVDQTRLRQIIDNLLSNAVKFTAQGLIEVKLDYRAPILSISVTDSGIGISSERIDAIFEPFEQADLSTTKTFGGTGLGLTISRQLARLMGGDLLCSSRPGEGSTFTLTVDAPPAGEST
ncbi:sensor histidine kinase [Pseudidiomarina mangrovi]|uniref:sensor histidine kinase n=1 Tax=Pseudidiomarina mangrovi TaxID=2487133 RepID=UPI000FCC8B47|nr:ATP-binding protein [Pseudidiomarina mangrovi]